MKHIKCHSPDFHLTFIDTVLMVNATGKERSSVYEEIEESASYMQHFSALSARRQIDDKRLSGWRRVSHWSCTERWWDREGESWLEKKKVMVPALSSAPLLQSPRQHAWQALKRGVITDKNNREAASE